MSVVSKVRVGSRMVAIGSLWLMPIRASVAQADAEVLSNATVVQMVAGKLSKDLILGKINSARPGYDLSAAGISSLVGFKVDQNIIKQMLQVADNARRSGSAPSTLEGLDEVLTNEIVVKMLGDKVPKPIVLAKIQMSRSTFDVSAGGLVSLTTSRVPDDVIKAMMLPPPAPVTRSTTVREPTPPPAATPKPAAAAAKPKPAAKDSAKPVPPKKPPV